MALACSGLTLPAARELAHQLAAQASEHEEVEAA